MLTPLTPKQKVNNLNELIEVLENAGEDCIKTVKVRGLWVDNYFVCEMYRDLIGRNFKEDFFEYIDLIRNRDKFHFSLNPNFLDTYDVNVSGGYYSEYNVRQIKILCLEILKQLITNP